MDEVKSKVSEKLCSKCDVCSSCGETRHDPNLGKKLLIFFIFLLFSLLVLPISATVILSGLGYDIN